MENNKCKQKQILCQNFTQSNKTILVLKRYIYKQKTYNNYKKNEPLCHNHILHIIYGQKKKWKTQNANVNKSVH